MTDKYDDLIRLQESSKFSPKPSSSSESSAKDRVIQYEESLAFGLTFDEAHDENAPHFEKSYESGEEKMVKKD